MLEAIARLDRRLMIGARRWLTGRTIVDAVARLGWKAIVDARRRLVRRAVVDVVVRLEWWAIVDALRRLIRRTIVYAPLLRNCAAMLKAVALIALADGRSRVGVRLRLLDRGALFRSRSLLRRPVLLDALALRIAVAAVVRVCGHPEGETQDRNEECGYRASRHVLRDCARPVATAS